MSTTIGQHIERFLTPFCKLYDKKTNTVETTPKFLQIKGINMFYITVS